MSSDFTSSHSHLDANARFDCVVSLDRPPFFLGSPSLPPGVGRRLEENSFFRPTAVG